MNRARRPGLFLVCVVLAGVSNAAAQALTFEPYPLKHASGEEPAEIGRLTVVENRVRGGTRTIQLAVVRLRSRAALPGPPIVYLAGGPGSSGIAAAQGPRFPLFDSLREIADVILLDQRGVGSSRPNLNCSERWNFDPAPARTFATLLEIATARISSCAERLRAQSVDLSAYNTQESADDVEELRRALGVPQVSLLGISYGTHLALSILKRHEARINRVVLAGVVGPGHVLKLPSNIQRALERVDAELQTHAFWRTQPGLVRMLAEALPRLEQAPAAIALMTPQGPVTVSLSAVDVRVLVSVLLEDRATIQGLPLMVRSLSAGQIEPFARAMLGLRTQPVPSAMNLAVECASGASDDRWQQILREEPRALLGRLLDFPQPFVCDMLGAGKLGDDFRRPVASIVPALLISGALDSRTPPENAEEVRNGLPNSAHVVIERAGHDDDLLISTPAIGERIRAFLRDGVSRSERIPLPPIPFAVPDTGRTQ